ncbi:MAG: metallophosphoesterase [Ignavibacteriae bacterium HGW-Ignavibacteriae-2]|nr:MAG: metallophosphoesterase [Ignavibacteriae bacterium HGW-Ignavibacteriae-2]
MRILTAIISMIFLSLFLSCEKSNPVSTTDSGINPFSNGYNERNMIVVISDLHLGADLTYAECNTNRAPLKKLLEQIRVAKDVKELVIAGDLFDEWFVPATTDTYQGRDQTDFVERIAIANRDVIDAFNRIIQDGNILVTYVPGNHDLTITAENVKRIFPGINQARDNEQGLGTYSPADMPLLAIEHGHRYNFFCAPDPISNQDIAPGTIMPPGYFFTRIATLHVIQNCRTAGDTIAAVTPNTSGDESQELAFAYWYIWKSLMTALPVENKFSDKIILTNIDGFKSTFSINDFMPYQSNAGGFIYMNVYKGIQDTWNERQTLNHVPVNIPAREAILNAASNSQTDNQAVIQYFLNPGSNKRIVIFGHTHDAKIISSLNYNGLKSIYANSGTWIDHNNVATTTMNFVVITPQNANVSSQTYVKVYNFEGEVVTKMAADSLRY